MIRFFRKKPLKEIYRFDDFLSQSDCKFLLDQLSKNKFDKARQYELGRHNKELFTIDEKITSLISRKIKGLKVERRKVKDFSSPFEFYKYDTADFIEPHTDSHVNLPSGLDSNYTALIYLNDDYYGGETYFLELKKGIKPKAGSLILFQHHLVHESQRIVLGTKFIYRSNWHIS